MSTKPDSPALRTSEPQGRTMTDPICRSLEWSLHRDPSLGAPLQPEEENSRWNKGEPLISFVLLDLTRNLLLMRAHVSPCVRKIFGAQRRIGPQKFRLTCSEPSSLFKKPHRYPRPHDAGFASAYVGATLDPGESITDVTRCPLKQLRLFRATQFTEQFFGFFQSAHKYSQGCRPLGLDASRPLLI